MDISLDNSLNQIQGLLCSLVRGATESVTFYTLTSRLFFRNVLPLPIRNVLPFPTLHLIVDTVKLDYHMYHLSTYLSYHFSHIPTYPSHHGHSNNLVHLLLNNHFIQFLSPYSLYTIYNNSNFLLFLILYLNIHLFHSTYMYFILII